MGHARERLGEALLEHGDDGLLESLRAEGQMKGQQDSRWSGIGELADALLNRRLFKPVARMHDRSHAKRLWRDYGTQPDERRQVEQAAARFAGISPAWLVVLWVPPERMRLKPALVLVDDGELIDTLLLRERSPRGRDRGADIYKLHRELWAVDVFVHPQVRSDELRLEALLSALAEQLQIKRWEDLDAPVQPAKVARRLAGRELRLTRAEERELKGLVPSFYDGSVTLREGLTVRAMADEYKLAWQAQHPGEPELAALNVGAADAEEGSSPTSEQIPGGALDEASGGDGQQQLPS